MPLVYSYKPSRDCYAVSGQNYTEPSVNGIPTVYNDGINGTKNVKEVADFGFSGLNNLEVAIIPSGIDYIGRSAFERSRLKNLFILDSEITVGERAFNVCQFLTGLFLGNSIKKIEKSGFAYISSVYINGFSELILPDSLTGIEDYGFFGAFFVSGFTLPKNIKNIGNYAFSENYRIDPKPYLYFPESLEYLGTGAFQNAGLKEVRFGSKKIDKILTSTFRSNTRLKHIYFHTGLKEIHSGAFISCQQLKNIYLPSGTILIGDNHFFDCQRLEYANIPSGTGNLTIPSRCFQYCKSLQRVDFGENISSIGDFAFYDCWNLNYSGQTGAQENPDSNFLDQRLDYWSGYGEIQNVKLITGNIGTGENDLLTITNLYPKAFDLPTGLISLGSSALSSTRVEKKLTLPKNLFTTNINDLRGVLNLESFEVHPDNITFSSESGILYNKAKTSLLSCPYLKTGEIDILETTNIIGSSAFRDTKFLSYISLKNVQQINLEAFLGSSLTGIKLSNQLNYIGQQTFANSNLRTIDFSNCSSLSSNGFQWGVFENCSNLTGLVLPTGNNFITLRGSTFKGCTSLLEVNIPDNVKHLGGTIFNYNNNLQRVSFGTGIEYQAYGDNGIGYMEGETVQSIERNLWQGNQNYGGALTGILIKDNHPSLRTIDGILYSKNSGVLINYPYGLSPLRGFDGFNTAPFIIPNHVTGISERAFIFNLFRTVFANYNVKKTRRRAFQFTPIETVTISNGEIQDSIVDYTQVSTIHLGKTGIFNIKNEAFANALSLTGITLPSGVNLLNASVFFTNPSFTPALSQINVDPDNPVMSSLDGVLYNKDQTTMIVFPAQKSGSLTLADNLTGIGTALRLSKINYLKFGKGISNVPYQTIYGNGSLTGIDFGEYVKSLEPRAVMSCSVLKSIYFGSGMAEFNFTRPAQGGYPEVFSEPIFDCYSLEEIIYPNKNFVAKTRTSSPTSTGIDLTLIRVVNPLNGSLNTGIFGAFRPPADLYGSFNSPFPRWGGKPKTVIRYMPLNDQECIINHIDFQLSKTLPSLVSDPANYYNWFTGKIPEHLYGRKVVGLSGLNNITGIFGLDDNFTKVLYIPSGIEIKNSYLESIKSSGLKKLEKIIVDQNNIYYTGEDGILYSKDKKDIIAIPIKYYNSGFCVEKEVQSIYGEAFAYNENIKKITFKGDAPQIGQNIFTGTNPNLKIYRKKYAVQGWGDYLDNLQFNYKNDNIIQTNGPQQNKFQIFSDGNGKLITFYDC